MVSYLCPKLQRATSIALLFDEHPELLNQASAPSIVWPRLIFPTESPLDPKQEQYRKTVPSQPLLCPPRVEGENRSIRSARRDHRFGAIVVSTVLDTTLHQCNTLRRWGCVAVPLECRWQVPGAQRQGSDLDLRAPVHALARQEVFEGGMYCVSSIFTP